MASVTRTVDGNGTTFTISSIYNQIAINSLFSFINISKSASTENVWVKGSSLNKGVPTVFAYDKTGGLIYGTDQGYVVTQATGSSVKVSNYSITALQRIPAGGFIELGDSHGDTYVLDDISTTWYPNESDVLGYRINGVLGDGESLVLAATHGIWVSVYGDWIVSNVSFTSVWNAGSIWYAGASNGHIYYSVAEDVYLIGERWHDLGNKNGGFSVDSIIIAGSQVVISSKNSDSIGFCTGTLNSGSTFTFYQVASGIKVNQIIYDTVRQCIWIAANNGHVYKYINGVFSDLGQLATETSVNCIAIHGSFLYTGTEPSNVIFSYGSSGDVANGSFRISRDGGSNWSSWGELIDENIRGVEVDIESDNVVVQINWGGEVLDQFLAINDTDILNINDGGDNLKLT